jgi:hypothetical protein
MYAGPVESISKIWNISMVDTIVELLLSGSVWLMIVPVNPSQLMIQR